MPAGKLLGLRGTVSGMDTGVNTATIGELRRGLGAPGHVEVYVAFEKNKIERGSASKAFNAP